MQSTNYTGLIVGVIILILSIIIAIVMLCIYIQWRRDKVQFLISFHENKIVQWVTIKWDVVFKRQEHEKEKGFHVNSNSSSVSKSSSISKDDFHGMQVCKDPDVIEPKVSDLEANNEPAYTSSPHVRESRRGTIGRKIGSLYATLSKFSFDVGKIIRCISDQTSMREFFAKIVNGCWFLAVDHFQKNYRS